MTTDDPALADRIRRLGNYGSSKKYVNEERGANSRLDPLHAAALRVKLGHLEDWTERRCMVAAHYLEALAETDLILPPASDTAFAPVWHLFVVRSAARDALQTQLAEAGIGTLIHYPIPPHRQAAYADLGVPEGAFPIAEQLAGEVLSLPMGPHLRPDAVQSVVEVLRDSVTATESTS